MGQGSLPAAFHSSDAGQTFTACVLPSAQTQIDAPLPAIGADALGDVFVVGPQGFVAYSSDFGATFAPVGPTTSTHWTSVAVSASGAVVIVGADGSVLTHS
jgi:photosystem II stability/assembly factor-like uncharacterized protein